MPLKSTSFRLDEETDSNIDKLAKQLNMTRVQVVKTAIANMTAVTDWARSQRSIVDTLRSKAK